VAIGLYLIVRIECEFVSLDERLSELRMDGVSASPFLQALSAASRPIGGEAMSAG